MPLGALGMLLVSACRKNISFSGVLSYAPPSSSRNSRTMAPERRNNEGMVNPMPEIPTQQPMTGISLSIRQSLSNNYIYGKKENEKKEKKKRE